MLKTEKKEERAMYAKKDTYTYEEVRPLIEAAIEDRARYLGFFYKVMPKDLFDKYAKKALYAYGEYKALGLGFGKGNEGNPEGLADFLVGANGVANTLAVGNQVLERDEECAWRASVPWCRDGRKWDFPRKRFLISVTSPATAITAMPTRWISRGPGFAPVHSPAVIIVISRLRS